MKARRAAAVAGRIAVASAGVALACALVGWIDASEWAALAGGDAQVAPPVATPIAKPVAMRVRRLRFDVSPGGAAVTHEIEFPRGALTAFVPAGTSPETSIFVAFTAQARPLAFEATRVPIGADGRPIEAAAQPLSVEHVVVRPAHAQALLGHPRAAGHVVHVPRGDAPFVLRLRSAIAIDTHRTSVDLLARLGVRDVGFLPVDRIEVAGALGVRVRGARATFCGADADAGATALAVSFPGYPPTPLDAGIAEPSKVARPLDDDLCVDVQIDPTG